jgi:uncharacterized glyoxalase superfamily protein PhnB
LIEHDLFGKPLLTFPDHALGGLEPGGRALHQAEHFVIEIFIRRFDAEHQHDCHPRVDLRAIKRAIDRSVVLQIEAVPLMTRRDRAWCFFSRLSAMSSHPESVAGRAAITAAEPQLFVADINTSCEFFASKLGFMTAFSYGEPPFYAQVNRDGARINLRCVERPVIDPDLRDREQLLSASLTVATAAEITKLFLEFQATGATFFQTITREPWGAKNFIVRDVDGNLILFAGPAE